MSPGKRNPYDSRLCGVDEVPDIRWVYDWGISHFMFSASNFTMAGGSSSQDGLSRTFLGQGEWVSSVDPSPGHRGESRRFVSIRSSIQVLERTWAILTWALSR